MAPAGGGAIRASVAPRIDARSAPRRTRFPNRRIWSPSSGQSRALTSSMRRRSAPTADSARRLGPCFTPMPGTIHGGDLLSWQVRQRQVAEVLEQLDRHVAREWVAVALP